MSAEPLGCPFCSSRHVRASLPATAQFFEYRCRDCKRSWFAGSVDRLDPEPDPPEDADDGEQPPRPRGPRKA